jgi:hypothetical protein
LRRRARLLLSIVTLIAPLFILSIHKVSCR